MGNTSESPAGLAGTTCRSCQNHLPTTPVPLGGHCGNTCRAGRNHISDVPEPCA
ncbi:hypothetical protein NGF31_003122 [Listeria monocytogenes]|nr:hypothetical protein [Listeria monocytogenes]EJP2865203.1 hypothetical protein [Campylobacter jejuni]EJP2903203.1 hypothetical protein [Campylobacter jejuni]HBF4610151.1 hypothetical protein [Clostridioides difficile]HBF5381175.1 hypothetical protein [Clostridioides difficile]